MGALNTKPKYVASTTLTEARWADTTVLSGDVAVAIGELKAKPGGDLQVHGSGALVRWLLENDLVDEMTLLIVPVVLGQGARLFPDAGPDIALDVVDSRADSKGVTIRSTGLTGARGTPTEARDSRNGPASNIVRPWSVQPTSLIADASPTLGAPGSMRSRPCRRPTSSLRSAAPDLELLATAASLTGRMDEYLALLERAHLAHIEAGENLAAAGCAGWLGMTLAVRGDMGPAGGWFARSQRLVDQEGQDCVERGYLLIPVAFQCEFARDYEGAYEAAATAVEYAGRFRDPDLAALALHVQGFSLIKQGSIDEGLELLDEAMVGVTADSVSPIVAGIVYCGVIAMCEEAFELRRAQEWTSALARWCDGSRRWSPSPAAASRTGPGSCSSRATGRTLSRRRGSPASAARRR